MIARCHVLALRVATLRVATLLALSATRPLDAQLRPTFETPVALDSARRILVVTPTLVARLGLAAPAWPVEGSFREARLFRIGDGASHVLVVQRVDSTVLRYAFDDAAVMQLQRAFDDALATQSRGSDRALVTGTGTGTGTGLVVSQPAGNTFVRNQTFLGLIAYGPATAALLSKAGGAAAGGGYFFAAGTSFFVAAGTVRNRVVTRAQAARAAHGGTRGALMGAGVAAMAHADGGAAWGTPILAGAIGGTIAGFRQARGLSDGEAASAGLFADLGALTVLGIAGGTGAFRGRDSTLYYDDRNPQYGSYTTTDNTLRTPARVAIGSAIGASVLGYAFGPRYARRAAYNVTSGDVNVAFTSALLGGVTASSLVSDGGNENAKYGVAAGGVLLGAFLADRGLVRNADRTSADGTLASLGALAGALMGAGVAAIAETEAQGALALGGLGGTLGLLAADGIIKPARDAGPLRGIMQSSSRRSEDRFSVSLGPVTAVRIKF